MYTCATRKRFQLGNNMSMMKKYYLQSFAFSTVYIRAYRIHGSKTVFEITQVDHFNFSVGCLWHSHGKIRFGCTQNCKASQ